jgi:signal transduction histidine kinase
MFAPDVALVGGRVTWRRVQVDVALTVHCPLAKTLAARLRHARAELTTRWLERIVARVDLEPNRVFPTDDLIDHVPLLIDGVADYIENPADPVGADPPVVAKAMELGALRHAQGFDEYELLKEYEILGGILFTFLVREVDAIDEECSRGELLVCAHRLFQAISRIQQATTTRYLQLAREQVREREERLRAFNRTLTHEFRNRINAVIGAGQLLQMADLTAPERESLAAVVSRNADTMRLVLDNLVELTGLTPDSRRQRHVRLPQAVAEATRQLADLARAHKVAIRVAPDLPDVEISAAAVELCVTNLVSNAVKYADPAKPERWVEVDGRIVADERGPREVVVKVRDNGLGVAPEKRGRLFERFFRAHESTGADIEGTGLGLSIVRETIESLGGRAWAEFPEDGSVFAFAAPCRRVVDAAPRRA